LGYLYREIGQVQHQQHHDDEAFASVERARRIFEELVQSEPDQAVYHGQLALTWDMIGILHDAARLNTLAAKAHQQAITEQELAIAKSKGLNRYKFNQTFYLTNLGEQFVDLGDVEKGLPYYKSALNLARELNKDKPDDHEYALHLINSLANYGNLV